MLSDSSAKVYDLPAIDKYSFTVDHFHRGLSVLLATESDSR
jgi:hypothetical protein